MLFVVVVVGMVESLVIQFSSSVFILRWSVLVAFAFFFARVVTNAPNVPTPPAPRGIPAWEGECVVKGRLGRYALLRFAEAVSCFRAL